jgi:hypothetical protein
MNLLSPAEAEGAIAWYRRVWRFVEKVERTAKLSLSMSVPHESGKIASVTLGETA